jgi:hypothetical protein
VSVICTYVPFCDVPCIVRVALSIKHLPSIFALSILYLIYKLPPFKKNLEILSFNNFVSYSFSFLKYSFSFFFISFSKVNADWSTITDFGSNSDKYKDAKFLTRDNDTYVCPAVKIFLPISHTADSSVNP